jgi:hypothetical protein
MNNINKKNLLLSKENLNENDINKKDLLLEIKDDSDIYKKLSKKITLNNLTKLEEFPKIKRFVEFSEQNETDSEYCEKDIERADEDNIYFKDENKTTMLKTLTNLRINHKSKSFERNLFAKNEYLKRSLNRERLVDRLLEKMNINLKDFFEIDSKKIDKSFIKKKLSEKLNINEDNKELDNIIDKQYNNYIKSIFEKLNFSKKLADYIFNDKRLFKKLLSDLCVQSIIKVLKCRNIQVSVQVLEYVIDNALKYEKDPGVVYSTMHYIAEKTFVSRTTALYSLRKLEYCGVIDYIAVTTSKKGNKAKYYKNKLSSLTNEKDKKYISKVQNNASYRENSNYSMFPVVNFDNIIEYIQPEYIKDIFQDLLYDIKYNFQDYVIENFDLNLETNDYEVFIQRLADSIKVEKIVKKNEKELLFSPTKHLTKNLLIEPFVKQKNVGNIFDKVEINILEDEQTKQMEKRGIFNLQPADEFFNRQFKQNKNRNYNKLYVQDYLNNAYITSKWIRDVFYVFYTTQKESLYPKSPTTEKLKKDINYMTKIRNAINIDKIDFFIDRISEDENLNNINFNDIKFKDLNKKQKIEVFSKEFENYLKDVVFPKNNYGNVEKEFNIYNTEKFKRYFGGRYKEDSLKTLINNYRIGTIQQYIYDNKLQDKEYVKGKSVFEVMESQNFRNVFYNPLGTKTVKIRNLNKLNCLLREVMKETGLNNDILLSEKTNLLYYIIEYYMKKSKDKMNFMKDVYSILVGVNKSPIVTLERVAKLFQYFLGKINYSYKNKDKKVKLEKQN